MVIRGRAPLRVSFGGGGTDVAPFCEQQGGAIIGSTINKYAYCSIVPRKDDQIIVHSLDFDMTVKYNTNENYVYDGRLDLVTAALKAMDIKQGCEVYLQCDAPPGSGLGTSSTVMVAMLTAMARWKGIMLDAYAMADLAYEVEIKKRKIARCSQLPAPACAIQATAHKVAQTIKPSLSPMTSISQPHSGWKMV